MLADILKWIKPVAVESAPVQETTSQETLKEKTSWETGFWSWLTKSFWEIKDAAMAWVNSPDPSDYLGNSTSIPQSIQDYWAKNLKYWFWIVPYWVGSFMKMFTKADQDQTNQAWLKSISWEDLSYIKSLNKDDAFNYLNKRWLVVDSAKTQSALDSYYKDNEKNIKRYWLDKIQQPKSVFSDKEESLLKSTKQKAFDTSSWLWLSDMASARTVQLMEDWFRSTIEWPKMSLLDIEDKYNKLKEQWVVDPKIDSIYNKSKEVYEKALPRISDIAIMQAKHVWKSNEETEDLVIKELKEKWFNNVNEYIYQDSKTTANYNWKEIDMSPWMSLADYMKSQASSMDILYQFKKADWLGYSSILPWKDLPEKFHVAWDIIWIAANNLNSWAQKFFSATNWAWLGWLVTWAKYWVWDLKLSWYEYSEKWTWTYWRWLAKWADFLPDAASFLVWTKWIDKLLRVWKLGTYMWWVANEWWIAYNILKWLKLSPSAALKWERAIQNVAYTALNVIPREMVVGTVWNARDPKSWSQDQEYRAMFDAAIWGMMWVWRQAKDISKINEVFQNPWDMKAYMDYMQLAWPTLPIEQVEFFARSHPAIVKSAEKYFEAISSWAIDAWDDLILWMKAEDFSKNMKKSYASAKVRDLYLKNGWQLTDADKNLITNMQKLVDDPRINIASILKLDRNIPWKVNFLGQSSNIKIKADAYQSALDWKYEKPVDDIFNFDWWKPDSVINENQLKQLYTNVQEKKLYIDLDKWVTVKDKDWADVFKPYIQKVDWWYSLTREWYEYLWIVDNRTAVDEIIKSDSWMDVSKALQIARDNWAQVSDQTISLIQNTDIIDKLISISWC